MRLRVSCFAAVVTSPRPPAVRGYAITLTCNEHLDIVLGERVDVGEP